MPADKPRAKTNQAGWMSAGLNTSDPISPPPRLTIVLKIMSWSVSTARGRVPRDRAREASASSTAMIPTLKPV
jgi:hypothetical protein